MFDSHPLVAYKTCVHRLALRERVGVREYHYTEGTPFFASARRTAGRRRNSPAKMNRKNPTMSHSELQHLQTRIAQWQSRHRDPDRLRAAYRRQFLSLTL